MGHYPIDRNRIEDVMGLTPMQEGILYHYLMNPDAAQYYEQYSYKVKGKIEISHFVNAWRQVLIQNEVLRTTFRWDNISNPIQIILKDVPLTVCIHDISHLPVGEKEKAYMMLCQTEREKGFSLDQEVLFKILLGKLDENNYIITVCNHHILLDGWSNGIILSEFITTYLSLQKGITPVKTQKPHFREYIKWLKEQDVEVHKGYWSKYLEGYERKGLQPDNSNQEDMAVKTECITYLIEEGLLRQLKDAVGKLNITLSDIFTAVWGILLQIMLKSNDIVFGTVVSGRTAEIRGIERMVGLIMNTIPVRFCTDKGSSVREILMNYHQLCQERKPHELVPLAVIQSLAGCKEESGLFDTLVVIENYPIQSELGYKFKMEHIGGYSVTNYPLLLAVNCFDTTTLNIVFRENIFGRDEISLLTARYLAILELITENPNELVNNLNNITNAEKELNSELHIEFNFK